MSNAIEETRQRLRKSDEFVKVVVWDHDLQTCERKEMPYKKARLLASQDRPGDRYEHRVILVPAY